MFCMRNYSSKWESDVNIVTRECVSWYRKDLHHVPFEIVRFTPKSNVLIISLGTMRRWGSRRAWSWKVNRGEEGRHHSPIVFGRRLESQYKGSKGQLHLWELDVYLWFLLRPWPTLWDLILGIGCCDWLLRIWPTLIKLWTWGSTLDRWVVVCLGFGV